MKKKLCVGTILSDSVVIPKELIDKKLAKYDSQFRFNQEEKQLIYEDDVKERKRIPSIDFACQSDNRWKS